MVRMNLNLGLYDKCTPNTVRMKTRLFGSPSWLLHCGDRDHLSSAVIFGLNIKFHLDSVPRTLIIKTQVYIHVNRIDLQMIMLAFALMK